MASGGAAAPDSPSERWVAGMAADLPGLAAIWLVVGLAGIRASFWRAADMRPSRGRTGRQRDAAALTEEMIDI